MERDPNLSLYQFWAEHEFCQPPVELSSTMDDLLREADETGVKPDSYTVTLVCQTCRARMQKTITNAEIEAHISALAARHEMTVEAFVEDTDDENLSQRFDLEAVYRQVHKTLKKH